MPCSLIRLTYKRDKNLKDSTNPTEVQVVALAKGIYSESKSIIFEELN